MTGNLAVALTVTVTEAVTVTVALAVTVTVAVTGPITVPATVALAGACYVQEEQLTAQKTGKSRTNPAFHE